MRGLAGLGCRRLAVIDLPHGMQPLANETGDVVVVCNGEIYNHTALRRRLTARGHRFRTNSDIEVIPHLYEEHGVDFVDEIEGMFAVAIWDARCARLVLARDRLGEKPLYYASPPGAFLFGSEPKALLATGRVDRAPNWVAVATYLLRGYVPTGTTAFAAIERLPPGGRLVLEGEQLGVDRYWDVTPLFAAPPITHDLGEAAQALRAAFERAVGSTLVSDVPVGIFLSGGLDSTAVAAVAQATTWSPLNTFAIRFETEGFDESPHAALVARTLGTRHHTLTITPESFLDGTRSLMSLLDEPLADPALIPTFLLSLEARRLVKVILVGEGSDELFAGYPTYLGGMLAPHYRRLPAPIQRVLACVASRLHAPRANHSLRHLARRFVEEAGTAPAARHHAWLGCFSREALANLATPGGPLALPPESAAPAARTELDALLAVDLTNYLPDDLLTKLDRATMAASLEGRAPFLDRRLVELACRLPSEFKLRGFTGKFVLRRAVADLVPDAILRRQKRGLTVPLAEWIAGPLRSFVRETVSRLDPAIMRPAAVRELVENHVHRRRDNRREIWALVVLQLWLETHGAWSAVAS